MKALISKTEKNERDKKRKREQRRDKDGLTSRERAKQEVMKKVSTLLKEGLKQKEIAEKLGLDKGYLSRIVKALKNQ